MFNKKIKSQIVELEESLSKLETKVWLLEHPQKFHSGDKIILDTENYPGRSEKTAPTAEILGVNTSPKVAYREYYIKFYDDGYICSMPEQRLIKK